MFPYQVGKAGNLSLLTSVPAEPGPCWVPASNLEVSDKQKKSVETSTKWFIVSAGLVVSFVFDFPFYD